MQPNPFLAVAITSAILSLAACGGPVDQRFAEACAEQKAAGPEFAAATENACRYAEYVPDEDKEKLIQLWADVKRSKKRLDRAMENERDTK